METRYLQTLIAAVEQGTFSKASESLHITQSAVSQRIKFLEEHFGQQLLDRTGPKLVLTQAGQVVLAKAREILEKEQELLDCLRAPDEKKHLSLCCTPTFGMAYLSEVLNDFIRIHSDMDDLKFLFQQPLEVLRGLRLGEFDLAIIEHCLDQDFRGLDRFSLPDDELLFVASPTLGLPLKDGCANMADLSRHRLFGRRDGCSSKEMLRQNLRANSCDFDHFESVVISDDLRYTLQAVLEGGGIAYVSRALVKEHLADRRLVGIRVQGFDHRRGRSVVLQPGRYEEPLISEMLECVFRVASPLWRPQLITFEQAARSRVS